jgi:hypothetical protein
MISADDVSATISETDAYFDDAPPQVPDEVPATEDLWSARTDWSIEARGDLKGRHDADSDRMFSGDTLNCRGKLTFAKAGRAGLIFMEAEGSAGVDERWREDDRDAEMAYLESLDAARN